MDPDDGEIVGAVRETVQLGHQTEVDGQEGDGGWENSYWYESGGNVCNEISAVCKRV